MRRRHALLLSLLAGAAVIAVTVGVVRAAGLTSDSAAAPTPAAVGIASGPPAGAELPATSDTQAWLADVDDDEAESERWDDDEQWDDDDHDDDDDHGEDADDDDDHEDDD